MDKSLVKKVSLIAIIFGVFMLLINIYNCIFILGYSDFITIIKEAPIYSTFILTIITIGMYFLPTNITSLIQIISLFVSFTLAVTTMYNSVYGIGLFILFILLFDSYGYLDNINWSLRIKVLFVYYVILTILSIIVFHNQINLYRVLINIGFTIFMLCIIYSVSNVKHIKK